MDEAQPDAQRLHFGDDDGREKGAGDGTHPADHHDDECIADHHQIEPEIGGLARHLQRAAKSGEESAKHEDNGEQHGLVDAERADHLAVLGGGADQPAEAGPRQHQVKQQQDERADRDQEKIVARKIAPENFDGAAQAGSAGPEQILRPPHDIARHR